MKNNKLSLSIKSKIWNKYPKKIKILIKSIKVRLGLEILIVTPYMGKFTVQTISISHLSCYSDSEVIDKHILRFMFLNNQIYYNENAKLFLKYL